MQEWVEYYIEHSGFGRGFLDQPHMKELYESMDLTKEEFHAGVRARARATHQLQQQAVLGAAAAG